MMRSTNAFTLIEVLIALAIIAIAFTALLKATSQDIVFNTRIQDKMTRHWVAMQGVSMIQLGLLTIPPNQEITQVTNMLGKKWYWRAKLLPTPIKAIQQIQITTSQHQSGPFTNQLIAYNDIHRK